jgi:hypothetical protein
MSAGANAMVEAAFAAVAKNEVAIERPAQLAMPLHAALMVFAREMEATAEATRAANKRGAVGRAKAYEEAAAILIGRAAELETHGPIMAAASRLDEQARPNEADMAALNEFVSDREQLTSHAEKSSALQVTQSEPVTCGITEAMGYVCAREPHEPGTGAHEGMGARWPDTRLTTSDQDQVVAFLRGETDELPPLGPPDRPVFDLGPVGDDFKGVITALNVTNPSLGHPVDPAMTADLVEGMMQTLADATGYGPNGEMVVPDDLFRAPDPPYLTKDDGTFIFTAVAASSGRPPWRLDPAPVPFAFDPSTALPAPDHVSYSQITTAEKCGLQLRIKKRDGVKAQPGYATVGGKAFHSCVELVEKRRLGLLGFGTVDRVLEGDLAACAELFVHNLDLEIAAAVRESGIPVQRWKVAAQGTEGDTWWRHNGALMLRDYVAWAQQRHEEGWAIINIPDKILGIELKLDTPVGWDMKTSQQVKIKSILDQVWFRWEPAASDDPDGTPVLHVHIEDPKTGARPVTDTFQLGLYAHSLLREVMMSFPPPVFAKVKITGSYYDARNGKSGDVLHPLDLHSWAEIEYRALTTLGMHEAGIYPANPVTAYGGPCGMCDVRHACPIMATRD